MLQAFDLVTSADAGYSGAASRCHCSGIREIAGADREHESARW